MSLERQQLAALALFGLISFVNSMEVKVFKQGVGKNAVEMVDETQFKNPEPSNFDEELRKKVDFGDEYDELTEKLPKYQVYKFGKNIGYTMVPIVTRPKPYWSTPMPRILLEKTWSTPDVLRTKTKSFKGIKATTPMPNKHEELLPPDDEQPKKHRLSNFNRRPTSSGKSKSDNTSGMDEQPQIHIVSPQPHRPNAFRRITISTTTLRPTTPSSKRTHPVWHNPNFIPTRTPLQVMESSTVVTTTSSPLIQRNLRPKWQPWWRRNEKQEEHRVLQVSSTLEANEDKDQKGVRHPIKSSEFISQNGERRVVSTASDGSPVEIIMAPQTPKPIVVQNPIDSTVRSNQFQLLPGPHRHNSGTNGAWSWRRTWSVGPDGRRVENFSSSGNVPKDRLPSNLSHSTNEQTQRIHTNPRLTTPSQQHPKCRVLEAEHDGQPTADNDPKCKLLYPGYPADNTCKCTFQVNGRDKDGCAVGFLYTCKPTIEFSQ